MLGATGNLGLRLIPALIAHGQTVIAYVRSASKLRGLISAALLEKISIYEGDALDSSAVEDALRKHDCDAVMNTAGNRVSGKEQILGKIATSVSSAAMRVGRDRGKPLRAWFIGGMGSLEYPGSGGWAIQDFMPAWMTQHHRETEAVMKAIPTSDLEWSLLCVAFMRPESEKVDLLPGPKHHNLVVEARRPPEWRDSWISYLPVVGPYLNVFLNIAPYTTKLEDVADLIAEDFENGGASEFVGELVGMKEESDGKSLRFTRPTLLRPRFVRLL